MALNPITKTKLLIDRTWDKIWSTIKDHIFTVSVSNQVEFPEINFPEVKFPEIPKPIDTTAQLQEIVNSIINQTQELKLSPDTTATKEQLLNILGEIKTVLSTKKEDLTPDLIAGIQALREELSEVGTQIPKTDLKPIQAQIEALIATLDFKGLKKFTRHDDIKVYINEKQLEKLMKAVSRSVGGVSGGGGGVMRTSSGEVGTSNPLPVTDPILEIAMGNISGTTAINKFGRNSACGATPEEIWDGDRAYVFPTTASITHIRSAVDSAITRGVTLEIQGLNDAYELVIQTKATDGTDSTTEVILDTALRRVFRVKVLDDTAMDQDIWVGPDPASAANASAIIQAGNNQTLMAIYTVPTGCTGYMTNYYATANPNNAAGTLFTTYLWARDNANGYAPQLKHTKGLDKDATSGFQHNFNPYYKFTEKTDIYVTGSAGTNSVSISAGFDIILVAN